MTIDATTGNDVLSGGNEVDTIDALAGADLVTGGSGDDNLQGGLSSDVLAGGAGSDVVVGGDGNDIVFGSGPPAESLRDVLLQNWITYTLNGLRFAAWADDGEADVLSGGSGNDVLWLDLRESVTGVSLDFAVDPNAVASAALGADVTGFETFNVLAGDFNDTISRGGVTVATQLAGGNGADTLTGGNGGDVLDSGSFLWGGGDDGHVDTLYGNSGSDTFHLGRGDVADGGVGSDTAYIYFSGLAVGEVLRLTVSDATAVADIQNASGGAYTTIERFGIVGTAGDDAIQGGNSVSNILGGGGNDTLTSAQSASNVNVYGEAGDDVIEMSGPYAATAYGGAGSDTITVIQRQGIVFHSDAVAAGAGLASLDDGAADTIVTGTQLDTVTIGLGDSADGGASNDTLVVYFVAAESGVNVDLSVNAASSLTTAVGGTIRNFELYALHGGAHNDTFIANAAATTLAGGEGTDVLTGGGSGDLLITT